jgi:hypothetical protein
MGVARIAGVTARDQQLCIPRDTSGRRGKRSDGSSGSRYGGQRADLGGGGDRLRRGNGLAKPRKCGGTGMEIIKIHRNGA